MPSKSEKSPVLIANRTLENITHQAAMFLVMMVILVKVFPTSIFKIVGAPYFYAAFALLLIASILFGRS